MNPVSPDSDNDDLQPSDSQKSAGQSVGFGQTSFGLPADAGTSIDSLTPLAALQRQYAEQLTQEVEQLEVEKTKLQAEISALKHDYTLMQTRISSLQQSADRMAASQQTASSLTEFDEGLSVTERLPARGLPAKGLPAKGLPARDTGPRLPGEPEVSPASVVERFTSQKSRRVELPTPATSEQNRQTTVQRQQEADYTLTSRTRRGLALSAIATLITAWHYGLVGTLLQGGSWLGIGIGQLGSGFLPAVALLWLRMLVMVPALVFLAPQLHRTTWEDLQTWFYTDERRFLPLIGGGIALFVSQVLLYQCIGQVGYVVATALFFLYPLSAILLGLGLRQEQALTPFGLLAAVAIAMGGFLVAKPAISLTSPAAVWLGLLASLALSLYIVLTNLSYQQQCHPIPTAVVQFSTVAVLSSLVLLIKPLKLVSISWLSFCLWGLLIGILMLATYFFIYSSLRLIGTKTAIVAAATPLVSLLLSWGFVPNTTLEIIQWTGILLVAIGGIALGKEKLNNEKLA
ncbi:MAG: EamA family transporter [Phormidesmis sp.]